MHKLYVYEKYLALFYLWIRTEWDAQAPGHMMYCYSFVYRIS